MDTTGNSEHPRTDSSSKGTNGREGSASVPDPGTIETLASSGSVSAELSYREETLAVSPSVGSSSSSSPSLEETVADGSVSAVGGRDPATEQTQAFSTAGSASSDFVSSGTMRMDDRGSIGDLETVGSEGGGQAEPIRISSLHDPLLESSTQRYAVTHKHAEGGNGRVWLARDVSIGRDVALKELKGERGIDAVTWSRFVEEARITARLEHPGIVPVYELGRRPEDNQPFYTMRFIRGRTLREEVLSYHKLRAAGEAGPVQLRELLSAFLAICNALGYAHARRVIHRDLKSGNVVLGEFGEVMLLDWGLAKVLGRPNDPAENMEAEEREALIESELNKLAEEGKASHLMTAQGQVLGTPAYMAPEQAAARNDQVDERTDVYGMGAILYEILTGYPPFHRESGESLVSVLRRVQEEAPQGPRGLVGDVPPALEAICLKAISKKPEDRYPSVLALADEVKHWLADEPVKAFPEPWTKRLSRWGKRHKTAVIAAGVLAATSLVGLSVGYVLVRRERDEVMAQELITRNAVNDMYIGVAEEWLEDQLDPKQAEFLEEALSINQRLSARRGASAAVRLETAQAYELVGDIQRKLGRRGEAEQAYRAGLEVMRGLLAGDPERESYVFQRAKGHARLGSLLEAMGDRAGAEPLLEQASEALLKLRVEHPESGAYAYELGRAERDRATLLKALRRNQDAKVALERAASLLEPLAMRPDAPVEMVRELGRVLEQQGVLAYDLGEYVAAREPLKKALAVQEPLLKKYPTNPRIREGVANSSDSLARTYSHSGDRAEAARWQERALGHYQRLADDFPDRPEYRRWLGRGHVNLGTVRQKNYDLERADASFRAAAALLEPLQSEMPDEPKVRRDLGIARLNRGGILNEQGRPVDGLAQLEQSVAIHEGLVKDYPEVPDYVVYLADSLLGLGSVLADVKGVEEGVAVQDRARGMLEELVGSHPDVVMYQTELARALGLEGIALAKGSDRETQERGVAAHRRSVGIMREVLALEPASELRKQELAAGLSNLAEVRLGGERLTDAEDLYREAIALTRGTFEGVAGTEEEKRLLGTLLLNLGEYLADAGRVDEALLAYEESGEWLEPLVAEEGSNPNSKLVLAYLEQYRGELELKRGDATAARGHLERAKGLQMAYLAAVQLPSSQSEELLSQIELLGRAILGQGEYVAAAETALELPQTAPERGDKRVVAARLLAQCLTLAAGDEGLSEEERAARARSYGDRAVAQLRVAIDGGYEPTVSLTVDPELRPLAGREDFQALAAETAGAL